MIVLREKEYSHGRIAARLVQQGGGWSKYLSEGRKHVGEPVEGVAKRVARKITEPQKEYIEAFKKNPKRAILENPCTTVGTLAAISPIPGGILGIPLGRSVDRGVPKLTKKLIEAAREYPYLGCTGGGLVNLRVPR